MLRLSATLFLVGVLHPARENPNNDATVFTEYAASADWTAVHLGQFAGIAVIIAGLLVLFFALNVHTGTAGWVGRFAAISAVVALALYGVLQAVDGVALKQAVDAWASAPAAEMVVGVGNQNLSELHVWSRAGPVRDHDREGIVNLSGLTPTHNS